MNKLRIVFISMLVSFVLMRAYLHMFPGTDFFVLGYEVHHFFSGYVLLILSAIPLLLVTLRKRMEKVLLVVFGVSLMMTLDEFVFMIATDATNESYVQEVSFYGAVVCIGIASVYMLFLYLITSVKGSKTNGDR